MAKIKIRKSAGVKSYDLGGGVSSTNFTKFQLGAANKKSTQLDNWDKASMAIPMAGEALGSMMGNSNAATAISDVTSLAGAGAAFGPWGMGAGAVLGVGKAIFDIAKANKEARRQQKIDRMSEIDNATVYGMNTGMNPFISAFGGYMDDRGVPIQAEKYQGQKEYIQSGNDVYPTNADTSHEGMEEGMETDITDVVNQGDFVFSARNKLTKKQWEAVATVLQNQGQPVTPEAVNYLTNKFKKKSISPAMMAETIDNQTTRTFTPTIFHTATEKLNERNKAFLLEQVRILNQAINPDKQAQTNAAPSAMKQGPSQAAWGGYFAGGNPVSGTQQSGCGTVEITYVESIAKADNLPKGQSDIYIINKNNCSQGCNPPNSIGTIGQKVTVSCVKGISAPGTGGGNGTTPPATGKTTCTFKGTNDTRIVGDPCIISASNTTPTAGVVSVDNNGYCICTIKPQMPNDPSAPGSNNSPGLPGQGTPGDKREQDMKKCAECIKEKTAPVYVKELSSPVMTEEQAAKECGCPNHLSADTTFTYDECASCMKELQAAAKASGKEINNMDAMKQCNCGASGDGKDSGNGFLQDKTLMALKPAADLLLAQAMNNQVMYPLVQSPIERMKTELPVSGVENALTRNTRSVNQQLLNNLPWNMAMSATMANSGQAQNQLSDYMGKRGEANVNLYNANQQFLDQQTSANAGAKQAWYTDQAKLKNMGTVAYGQAGQTSVDALLQYRKDSETQRMQVLQLRALLKQLGLEDTLLT